MTAKYTVKVREHRGEPWRYIDKHFNVVTKSTHCKPLSRSEAEEAKQLLTSGAAKLGRPILVQVTLLRIS